MERVFFTEDRTKQTEQKRRNKTGSGLTEQKEYGTKQGLVCPAEDIRPSLYGKNRRKKNEKLLRLVFAILEEYFTIPRAFSQG